jgi:4a-hydroxytetrahydrobiopterin dehydratase
MSDLLEQRCKACEGGVDPLSISEAKTYLEDIPGWNLQSDGKALKRNVTFKNYYHTVAFVNAVAFIAHDENHHPDLTVSYNKCEIFYTTHAISGLSVNDFICAAKVNKLIETSKGS